MLKNILKYLSFAGVITVVGLGTLFFIQYLQYRNSQEYQTKKFLEKWEKAYREDMYGGNTPEETLQLFIDALKKGDTDLAAKYFIIDEQEKWKENLAKIKQKEMLDDMVEDLEREKSKYQISDGQVGIDITNDDNEIALSILLGKGSNGKWKIIDL